MGEYDVWCQFLDTFYVDEESALAFFLELDDKPLMTAHAALKQCLNAIESAISERPGGSEFLGWESEE